MVDGAGEEVGYGLLTPVRVVGEAGAGVDGEVVEHEEGGEVPEAGGADGAADAGAGAFGLFGCEEDLTDWAGGCGGHCACFSGEDVGDGWCEARAEEGQVGFLVLGFEVAC